MFYFKIYSIIISVIDRYMGQYFNLDIRWTGEGSNIFGYFARCLIFGHFLEKKLVIQFLE